MNISEKKANEVCSALKNQGFEYAFNPLIIITVIQIIYQLIKLYFKIYGKPNLFERLRLVPLLRNSRMKKIIHTQTMEFGEFYEEGVKDKLEKGLMSMFSKLTKSELDDIIKEGKLL